MNIQKQLDKLSLDCLKNNGIKTAYEDQDMLNATLVFTEVLMSKMYDKKSIRLSHPKLEILSAEMGKELRKYIKKYTGLDMHKVAANIGKK